MGLRQATRRYADLTSFLVEYPSTLGVHALVLPAGTLDGPPAPEIKVDLVLPLLGRVGPLVGQVVATMPDGAVALRIIDTPSQASAAIDQLLRTAEQVKEWLLSTGQLVPAVAGPAGDEVARLRARVRELEALLAPGSEPATAPPSSPDAPPVAPPTAGAPPAPPSARARGHIVPSIEGIPASLSGELSDRSFRDALMALAIERQTGLLTLTRPDGRVRWGFWSKGGPVAWRSEPIEEQEVLGVLLYRAGSLTREQLAESLARMERTGGRQGEALVDMDVLTFPQLVRMLQTQVDFILKRALLEREGTWTFHLLPDLPERYVTPPLKIPTILYRAMLASTRDLPAQELAGYLRPWLDHFVTVAAGVERTFDEMKLTPEEQEFLKLIQRAPCRLRESFTISSLSRSQTAAAVWCLYDLNLLEFKTVSPIPRKP